MRIGQNFFRGEAPRLAPELLPPVAGQVAVNCRLLSGNLEAWRQFDVEHDLVLTDLVKSIYKLNDVWLAWESDVDAARGPIPGDTTFRLFLTSTQAFDRPQFTNYAMATAGPEPYPVQTRPLGVPPPDDVPTLVLGIDPTPKTFSIDIEDTGDELASSWTVSPDNGVPFHQGEVTQVGDVGKPPPSYLIRYDENDPSPQVWMSRNFGVQNAQLMFMSCDVRFDFVSYSYSGPIRSAQFTVQATSDGLGVRVMVLDDGSTTTLAIGKSTGWGNKSSSIASVTGPSLVNSQWYTVTTQSQLNADGTRTIIATLYLGSAQLMTVTTTNVFDTGDWCGMTNITTNDEHGDAGHGEGFYTHYDNIHVLASGSTNYTPIDIATSYVYTFVNDLSQESAPSLPSETVKRPDGVSVTITTATNSPTGIDGNFGIRTKRIYRAATGNTGTVFRFVAEIPLHQDTYVDVLHDTELGEVLPSENWDLPPGNLEGILALPNGVMVGFANNKLCFSAQNHPHAWPVDYQLITDTPIVGIGNVDTTVVIFTQSFLYVAFGNDPASYTMSKFEVPHAGVAKRSIAYIEGVGVLGATPNGLLAVQGVGQAEYVTRDYFTRQQWQALAPHSIIAASHEGVYFFAYDATDANESDGRGAYALDLRPNGFGLVELSFHWTAAYSDPKTDQLFLVLDTMNEPSDTYLPISSSAPDPDGSTIYEFDARSGTDQLVYLYRSRLNLLDYPTVFAAARLRAKSYANVILRVYADGNLIFEEVIHHSSAFVLPTNGDKTYETLEYEILGTVRVRTIDFAEDMVELMGSP